MCWSRELGCHDAEASPVEEPFEDPRVGRELLPDVGFEVLPAETLAIGVPELVDHLLEVLGVVGRGVGEDDIPDVQQAAWLEVAGDVEQGGLLPEAGGVGAAQI